MSTIFRTTCSRSAHAQDIHDHWRPALPDPDDDFVLELAVAAGCQYIVTHKLRDVSRSNRWAVQPIAPAALLKHLETLT
jgi:predicted nucleic acid-binding protein